jgi:hypothetical protein
LHREPKRWLPLSRPRVLFYSRGEGALSRVRVTGVSLRPWSRAARRRGAVARCRGGEEYGYAAVGSCGGGVAVAGELVRERRELIRTAAAVRVLGWENYWIAD